MRALDRKLLRDLGRMKGQAAAIAVVIAAGVMTLVIAVATLDTLRLTQQRFYQDYLFADLFGDLERAPDRLAERIQQLPGVDRVETRVRAPVRLRVPGYDGPVRGQLLSLPDGSQPLLNRLHLREGNLPQPGRNDQVVISEAFAQAHGLHSGDRLSAIIEGRHSDLQVTGIALSPEFVYQIAPSDLLPDYRRYGILWMNRDALARAYDMDGAFNNVVLRLQPGASADEVIAALEQLLGRYGLVRAHDREEQHSHRFLSEELKQLRAQAFILPTIFLLVSAFLLNRVISRVVLTQREQIAVLKAFGYRDGEIAGHYARLTGLVVLLGWLLGTALGAWAASALAGLYTEYFRFPEMRFRMPPWVLLLALATAAAAATLGTAGALSRALRLAPAEAMRPAPPARFRHGWLERLLPRAAIAQTTRIILRNLARNRFKSALSVVGIAMSAGLLVMGAYQLDAVDRMIDTQYRLVLRMDLDIGFTGPTPARAVGELRHAPGVQAVETYRAVAVRLRHGHRSEATSLLGLEPFPQLRQVLDAAHRPQRLPPEGVLLTSHLADTLGLAVGDTVEVEVLEGHRRILQLPLAATVDEPVGGAAYMQRAALNRALREGPTISGAWLMVDASREQALYDELWERPGVASIGRISDAARGIRDYMGDTVQAFATVFTLLAGSIAFAVVYNNARISFAERARELATLEVLGYSRLQVSWILLGESGLLVLLALPLGWLFGAGFSWAVSQAFSTDLFRIPLVITPRAFGYATAWVLAAALFAGMLMVRRLKALDRVAVLKAVE
jgi:putative ABC transport system permease protein